MSAFAGAWSSKDSIENRPETARTMAAVRNLYVEGSEMTDRERADALWDRMAELGWVDGRPGAEYDRVSRSLEFDDFEAAVSNLVKLANARWEDVLE